MDKTCTAAVIRAAELHEIARASRISDRSGYLLMRNLLRSPSIQTMSASERHRLLAYLDGELTLSAAWRLIEVS